jgi:hypothetical protein
LISKGATLKDSKDVLDRDMIYFDPVRQGNTRSILTTFIRSLVPGSLGIGFLISEPLINIVLYYAFLIIGFAWTISTQYIITRQNTKTIYFSTRKNKLTLLQEMKKYINERLAEVKQKERDIDFASTYRNMLFEQKAGGVEGRVVHESIPQDR